MNRRSIVQIAVRDNQRLARAGASYEYDLAGYARCRRCHGYLPAEQAHPALTCACPEHHRPEGGDVSMTQAECSHPRRMPWLGSGTAAGGWTCLDCGHFMP